MTRSAKLLRLVVSLSFVCLGAGAAVSVVAQPSEVDPRLEEAIGWYTGTLGMVDDARAHELLVAAVSNDHPVSRMWLARCHSTGRMGFTRDPERAVTIASDVLPRVRRLALNGEREALFLVGTAYDEGLGVEVNPLEAVQWYRRAAERGHVLAQHNLGNIHEAGRGVAKDDAQAIAWWRLAADQGDAIPMFRLGEMYEAGRGVPRDMRIARDWYERAAARGLARARDALARVGG